MKKEQYQEPIMSVIILAPTTALLQNSIELDATRDSFENVTQTWS